MTANSIELCPIQIATVVNNEIIWNLDALQHILTIQENPFIKIVVLIGRYQMGKTSFIKLMTGNNLHQIGNGDDPKTNGATIDGPYNINDLAERWKIQLTNENVQSNQKIYFIDLEGFDSKNPEIHNILFIKMCIPLISISSNIIFLVDKNESYQSITTLLSAIKYFSYGYDIIDKSFDKFLSPFHIMNVLRNVQKYIELNYQLPNEAIYSQMLKSLKENWEAKRFVDATYNIFTTCLPQYDECADIFQQNDSFKTGFKFVVSDILNMLNQEGRISLKCPNEICKIISGINEAIIKYRIDSHPSHFFEIVMENKMNGLLEFQVLKIEEIITEFTKLSNYTLSDNIPLEEQSIYSNIYDKSKSKFDKKIREEFNEMIRKSPQFLDLYNSTLQKIQIYINNRKNDVRTSIINEMVHKTRECTTEIIGSIKEKLNEMDTELRKKPFFDFIPNDEKIVKHLFHVILIKYSDLLINQAILANYIKNLKQIQDEINNMHASIDAEIDNKIKGLVGNLNRKKKIQKFAKIIICILFGGIVVVSSGCGFCVGGIAASAAFGPALASMGTCSALANGIGVFSLVIGGIGIKCKIDNKKQNESIAEKWENSLNENDFRELLKIAKLKCLKFMDNEDKDLTDINILEELDEPTEITELHNIFTPLLNQNDPNPEVL